MKILPAILSKVFHGFAYYLQINARIKMKVKLSLFLTKQHTMKTYSLL